MAMSGCWWVSIVFEQAQVSSLLRNGCKMSTPMYLYIIQPLCIRHTGWWTGIVAAIDGYVWVLMGLNCVWESSQSSGFSSSNGCQMSTPMYLYIIQPSCIRHTNWLTCIVAAMDGYMWVLMVPKCVWGSSQSSGFSFQQWMRDEHTNVLVYHSTLMY